MVQNYTSAAFADALSELRNNPSSRKRIEGWIEDFDPEKKYGFIRHEPRNGIFFMFSDVIPDVIGRQFLKPGSLVSFELTESRGRFRALNVKDESPELLEIDPDNCSETSYVSDWRGSYGFLVRPNGERLYFKENRIITIGLELLRSWDGVNDPVWVMHKIGSAIDGSGRKKFFATDVQILEPSEPTIEQIFLQAPELPIDVPEPVAIEPPGLAPATFNLKL